ncbi:MAG: hypothetical protein ABH851_03505 [Methanobacteriota archaeon]
MSNEIVLKVGEKANVKTGWLSKIGFVYCGMPSEKTFSISYHESSGYQGFAMNLYYPTSVGEIRLRGKQILVLNVSQEKLTLRVK